MIRTLCWKEWREQRGAWLLVAGLATLLVAGLGYFLAPKGLEHHPGREVYLALIQTLAVAYGVVCGAQALAGEAESGTLEFLDAQRVPRRSLWLTKAVAGAGFVLAQALLLTALALFLGGGGPPAGAVLWLALLGLNGFAWGLAGSALTRTVLAAGFAGAGLAAAGWLITLALFHGWGRSSALLWGACAALTAGAAAFSSVAFNRDDRRRAASPARGAAGWRGLLWLVYRQGRAEAARVLGASVALGVALPLADPLLWPVPVVVLGAVCGAATFGSGRGELGDLRLPPWGVWAGKVGCWLAWAVVATAAMGLGVLIQRLVAFLLGAESEAARWITSYLFSDPWLMLVVALLLHGFAAGLVAGMLLRRGLAEFVAVTAAAPALLWLPSAVCGGLESWIPFVPPLLLLGASRLMYWPWAGARQASWRVGGAAVGAALLGFAWIAGALWQRVTAFPDIGAPFDRAAFERSLDALRGNPVRPLLLEAAEGLEAARRAAFVAAQGGEPAREVKPAEVERWYLEKIHKVLYPRTERKSPWGDAELNRAFDTIFAGGWVAKARAAAALPLGLVQDPRHATLDRKQAEFLQRCSEMGRLFTARAAQLRARGDGAGALDHLLVALGLSRQYRHRTSIQLATAGVGGEDRAVAEMADWLASVGPRRELLSRALNGLTRHVAETPPIPENVEAEWFAFRAREDFLQPRKGWIDGRLYELARAAPWEAAREERLLNLLWAARLRCATVPYWAAASSGGAGEALPCFGSWRDNDAVPWVRAARQLPWGPEVESIPTAWPHERARRESDLQALRLQLALALYEIDEGKPAARLADLVPRYLRELPRDPFSGRPFGYRVSAGERLVLVKPDGSTEGRDVARGQGILWSTGPDRADHGGRRDGPRRWLHNLDRWGEENDLIYLVPSWAK